MIFINARIRDHGRARHCKNDNPSTSAHRWQVCLSIDGSSCVYSRHLSGEFRLSWSRFADTIRREIIRPDQSKIHTVDGLRAMASAVAILFHCALFLGYLSLPNLHTNWVAYIARNGWAGLPVFFVLSGFLIGRILIQDLHRYQQLFFRSFFIRRAFRIFPAYYLVISVSLYLIAPLQLPAFNMMYGTANWRELFSNSWSSYLYVQNYVNPGPRANILNWGWSLAVEEQFYFLMPLILYLLFRVRSEPVRQLAIFILLLLPLLGRVVQYAMNQHIVLLDGFYYYSHNRIDELLIGMVIAYYYVVHREAMQHLCERLGGWLGVSGMIGVVITWIFGSQYFPILK